MRAHFCHCAGEQLFGTCTCCERPIFQEFPCCECEGVVKLAVNTGYERHLSRSFCVRVPDEMELPKCDRCGDVYLDQALSLMVDTWITNKLAGRA